MDDKVSIIIPAFNREKEIKKAINSCLDQSYTNIEVIVIDDRSTDHTVEVVKKIMETDDRVKLYHNDGRQKGANAARNIGFRNATGYYITFCDSDDYLLMDSLQDRVDCFEKHPNAMMVYGDAYCELHNRRTLWKYDDIKDFDQRKYLLNELSLCQQNTIMFKAEILQDIGYLDELLKGWTDDALVLSIGLKYPIYHCHKVVTIVVKSKESMTSNKKNLYLGLKKLLKKYAKEIINEIGFKRYWIWKIRLFCHWIYYKQCVCENLVMKEVLGCMHGMIKKRIRCYFRHYFE